MTNCETTGTFIEPNPRVRRLEAEAIASRRYAEAYQDDPNLRDTIDHFDTTLRATARDCEELYAAALLADACNTTPTL